MSGFKQVLLILAALAFVAGGFIFLYSFSQAVAWVFFIVIVLGVIDFTYTGFLQALWRKIFN